MPIVESDILYKYSVPGASSGDWQAGTGNGSLGKFMASNTLASGTLHNLFDVVSGAESNAGDIEYRCIFVHNNHASLSLQNPVIWLESEVSGGANSAIGLSLVGATAHDSGSAQAEEIANEGVAPVGVTFSAPASKGAGLALPTLAAGQCHAIWIRRTVPQGAAAKASDGATLRVEGDTAE